MSGPPLRPSGGRCPIGLPAAPLVASCQGNAGAGPVSDLACRYRLGGTGAVMPIAQGASLLRAGDAYQIVLSPSDTAFAVATAPVILAGMPGSSAMDGNAATRERKD